MPILTHVRRGALAAAVCSFAIPASAARLQITITNTASPGGFSITPVYSAFHDGLFDAFNVGQPASAGLEALAEDGIVGGLPAERLAQSPGSVATVLAQPASGPPTIDPGETSTARIKVDGSVNRYFTFLSMLVPSNDTFLGNDDPLAYELFGASGDFLGTRTINVTAASLYDAGTEVNDPLGTPAFVLDPDGDFTPSVDEGGTVQEATSLADFAGVLTPLGALDGGLIDFTGDPAAFDIATITISQVPLPPSIALGVAAFGALTLVRARRA